MMTYALLVMFLCTALFVCAFFREVFNDKETLGWRVTWMISGMAALLALGIFSYNLLT